MIQLFLCACTGVQTYPNIAQSGDTISLALGWQKRFKRANTTVTITPSVGEDIVYLPGSPELRAIINFYPDPVSNLVVGTKTQNDTFFKSGKTYGLLINAGTGGDEDWWQTVAFVNLPSLLSVGEANIEFTNNVGDTVSSVVNIVGGSGGAEPFDTQGNGPLNDIQLASLERSSNFEVTINSAVIPYAVEMEFLHTEKARVVNPNDLKNIIWTDNGSVLKVMLLPASSEPLSNLHEFKYYITGAAANEFMQNIQELTLQSVKAYDINGNIVTGVGVSLLADFRF